MKRTLSCLGFALGLAAGNASAANLMAHFPLDANGDSVAGAYTGSADTTDNVTFGGAGGQRKYRDFSGIQWKPDSARQQCSAES